MAFHRGPLHGLPTARTGSPKGVCRCFTPVFWRGRGSCRWCVRPVKKKTGDTRGCPRPHRGSALVGAALALFGVAGCFLGGDAACTAVQLGQVGVVGVHVGVVGVAPAGVSDTSAFLAFLVT